jgi:hypothetical protein
MFSFLKNPYPFNDDLKHNAKIIFFISIGVFLILLLFQPFNISDLDTRHKLYLVGGIGVITFLSLSINLLMIPSFFPRIFLHKEWMIWKEILWNFWILSTIGAGYFFLYRTLSLFEFDGYMIIKLLLISVVPLTLLIFFNQQRLLKIHLRTAKSMNQKLKENKEIEDRLVQFDSEYQKDKLSVKVKMLLLVRSADNYIEVFWKDETGIKSQLIRSSLLKTEVLVHDFNFMYKCHRSYLVNINFIDRVEGNSQGYKLYMEQLDFSIPVSRNAVNRLKELVQAL